MTIVFHQRGKMATSSAEMRQCFAVLVFVALLACSQGFYLPGVAPRAFQDFEPVNMKVQTLVSTETPLQFDYYQLPFCEPSNIQDLPENLGEALAGEKAHTSAFQARMKEDEYCKTLCRKKFTPEQMEEFQDFAILEYRVNMRLDNLPIAEMTTIAWDNEATKTEQFYNLGYPLGSKLQPEAGQSAESDLYVLNNHLRFRIKYHPASSGDLSFSDDDVSEKSSYIVGFEVIPFSIKHTYYGKFNESAIPYPKLSTCLQPPDGRFEKHQPQVIDPAEGGEVIFTYDVEWVESDVKWASRWDVYLQLTDDRIHWFSIVNSLVILVFLTGIVGLIMTRILRKDFARYNEAAMSAEEREEIARDMREETGWKLVYGDVFRPPPFPRVLAVYAGTGMQLFVMSFFTLLFATLGFLSPANRGALLSSVLLFFVLMGAPAGYSAARLSKLMREENHYKTTMMTATLFPGACFVMFFLVNLVAWFQQSSTAVPFGTLVVLCLLWFGVSLPLVFFGAYMGYKKDTIEVPCKTSPIPRQIPPQPWYLGLAVALPVGGLLPFGAVFVEMFFIISSIWQHRFYYMFGFLALVFLILIITAAEMTIVLCYLHLCAEEYRWWWRSFFTGGATAGYIFLYGSYHFLARAHPSAQLDILSTSVYFGYLLIFSYAIFVLMGYVGFISSFMFIKKIYSCIKID